MANRDNSDPGRITPTGSFVRQSSTSGVYIAMMIGAACSYGVVSSVLKLAYRHGMHTGEMTSAQYDIACLVMWLVVLVWRSGWGFQRNQWPVLISIGLCGTITSFAYYFALTTLPVSLAIVLLFQFTWMVSVIDMIVKRRWITRYKWMGLAIILCGTFLAVGIGQGTMHLTFWGIVCGLIAACSYGLQLYLSEYVDETTSPALRSAVLITISATAASCVSLPTWLWDGRIWHGLWFWGLLAALFSQVIPMLLMSISIPRIGGRMAGVLGAAELPAVVILAWVMLHEVVSIEQWCGIALILGGMVVSERLGTKEG